MSPTNSAEVPGNGLDATWRQVRDFHFLCKFPVGSSPSELSSQRVALWSSWLNEELTEFSAAIAIEDQADAAIDLLYFVMGALVEMGVPPQPIFDLVHKSNLAKVMPSGAVTCDSNGKVIKPAGWQSPKTLIRNHIEELRTKPSHARGPAQAIERKILLLLSGAIGSGKSEVSKELATHYAFRSIGTGNFLSQICKGKAINATRSVLQDLGDELDIQTEYWWPVEVALESIAENPDVSRWLLDSVRKERQVINFRSREDFLTIHVHLTASERTLRSRYEQRAVYSKVDEKTTPYEIAIGHPNEAASRTLGKIADAIFDTEDLPASVVAEKIVTLVMEKEKS